MKGFISTCCWAECDRPYGPECEARRAEFLKNGRHLLRLDEAAAVKLIYDHMKQEKE